MTTSFLMLLASSLPTSAGMETGSPFERALRDQSAWVVRAQSPETVASSAPLVAPPQGIQSYYQPGYPQVSPGPGGTLDPFANPAMPQYPAPITQDPWAGGTVSPYMMPAPNQPIYTYGLNGPQPVRFGWQDFYDVEWIPNHGTSGPNVGQFEVFGVNVEKIYAMPVMSNWVFSIAPQFNYRSWQGPDGTMGADLPPNAYRFGLGLTLQTPNMNGWTFEGGFNPAVGTDFNHQLTSDAWMFDAHAVAYWQWTPQFMVALGAFYWDRVDNIILPYAGVVWNPNDIWEFRLLFPESRISFFLGTPWGLPTWIYATGEYHVEAYQVQPGLFASATQVQLSDWRVLGGLRCELGWLTTFVEAGYVFDRKVDYKAGGGFDPNDGFIGRLGIRF